MVEHSGQLKQVGQHFAESIYIPCQSKTYTLIYQYEKTRKPLIYKEFFIAYLRNKVQNIRLTMSPFSYLLHDLRLRHGLSQAELAQRIGYEQSYVSSVEIGLKGPPANDFLDRLSTGLALTLDEKKTLYEALDASQRKLVINADSPSEIFLLLRDLREGIDRLSAEQIWLIRGIVNLPTSISPVPNRTRRLKRKPKEEITM